MTAFLESYPSGSGRGAFAPEFAERIDAVRLVGGVAEAHPIPAGFRFAVFSFTGNVFVRTGGADVSIALPNASTTSGDAPELNPAARRLNASATHIALVSRDDCLGSIAFYR